MSAREKLVFVLACFITLGSLAVFLTLGGYYFMIVTTFGVFFVLGFPREPVDFDPFRDF